MTWSLVGWAVIGLSALMLVIFNILFKNHKAYPVRRFPAVDRLTASRAAALERGKKRAVILGHELWSPAYPGLGLGALSIVSPLLEAEQVKAGGQVIAAGDGGLLLLARQIAVGRYRDGFSKSLIESDLGVILPGMTPLSFTAGLLPELRSQPYGSMALVGNVGPEAVLWAEAVADIKEHVFAAAGPITSQAVLFPSIRDLIMGEGVFLLPGLLKARTSDRAGFLTEDILRMGCILLLVIGGILKLAGIL